MSRHRSRSEEDEYWYNKKCDYEEYEREVREHGEYVGKQEQEYYDAELLEQSMIDTAKKIDKDSDGWEPVPADLKNAKNVKNAKKIKSTKKTKPTTKTK